MTSIITKASKHLKDAKVTGFSTPGMSLLVYAGSFSWFLVLVGFDAFLFAVGSEDVLRVAIVTSMTLNGLMFVVQTVNVLYYNFKLWLLTSLYWTCQLTCIGICGAGVGYTLVPADDGLARLPILLARLLAQCLFTSSQFAVMLEYLHRAIEKPRPSITPSAGRRVSAGSVTTRRYSR